MDRDPGDDDPSPHDRTDYDHLLDPERDHAELSGCSRNPSHLTTERYLA